MKPFETQAAGGGGSDRTHRNRPRRGYRRPEGETRTVLPFVSTFFFFSLSEYNFLLDTKKRTETINDESSQHRKQQSIQIIQEIQPGNKQENKANIDFSSSFFFSFFVQTCHTTSSGTISFTESHPHYFF